MITFRAIMEVLGKPKEHVEQSLQGYIEKLKENSRYKVLHIERAEIKKQEEAELWATFAELEIQTSHLIDVTSFCIDYMPSLIEILEPPQITLKEIELSTFLNDVQAKLHGIDMIAKQVKFEHDAMKKNLQNLLANYIILILSKNNFTSEELSKMTGVATDTLEDFLDHLIDQGKVDLKEGIYFLKKKE